MKRNLLCAAISLGLLFILSFSALHPVYAGSPVTPTITTVISGDTSIGGQALDTATVTGTPATAPGGTLTFYLYDNPSCNGPAVFSFGSVAPSAQDSATGQSSFGPAYYTIISAGTFYWVATYSGDSNYNSVTSGCADEPVTFTLATPTITTTQDPNSQVLGGGIFDQASLSGGFNPTGTVTFNLYDNAGCSGTPLFTDTESIPVNSVYSSDYTPTSTGTFYWVATYNGDSNNNPVSSGCADEPVTVVTTLTPTITTIQQPASSVVGKAIADQATVSTGGLTIPTGTVTFNLYDNAGCSGTPLFTDTESVQQVFAGVDATSASYTTTSSGTFYWVATYNGDTYDSSVSSSCGAEPVVVTGATGAPEFPLGSLSPLLLIALLFPALVVMGKKFGARQPV